MSEYLFDDNHLFTPLQEHLSEGTVKSLRKKGYVWDPHESWWVRVWKTPTEEGEESCLECFSQTMKGQWVKLMISETGHTFYEEDVDNLA
jgi:hypothetical protein